jgi:hypothetical protein
MDEQKGYPYNVYIQLGLSKSTVEFLTDIVPVGLYSES